MAPIDVAILIVYSAIFFFFLRRFVLRLKPQSLGVALLPSGWVVLALDDVFKARTLGAVKWFGILAGTLLFASLIRIELEGRK